MAHEVTSALFMHSTAAWHGEGDVIEGTVPAPDAFRRAGALFPVEKLQLWAGDLNNPELLDAIALAADQPFSTPQERGEAIHQAAHQHLINMADSRVAIWRPDTRKILGTASPDYKIIPNQRLLDFASALREECDMDAVIVLREGAKVAFTAKIRGTDQQVIPGDKVYRNIVGYLGHDGSTAFGGIFTDTRVVCLNTLGYAMNDANRHGRQFTIKHTENDVAQIDRILSSIDIARQSFAQVVDEYRAMREVPMTTDLYRHFLEQVYEKQIPSVRMDNGDTRPGSIEDMPRKWAKLEHAWNYGLGRDIPGVAGTLYWGLNAVTEVESSGKTQGAGKRRIHSALFGTGAGVIKRANEVARELVHA
jgi:phage/plasmid-like protein (TIGR03299 family)